MMRELMCGAGNGVRFMRGAGGAPTSTPIILGWLGPQMSMSSSPTWQSIPASPMASCAENVLFPTPPLPLSTRILCLTQARRSAICAMAGSGLAASPEAHSCWFGQPAHADAFPALCDAVPGHSAGASAGRSVLIRQNL